MRSRLSVYGLSIVLATAGFAMIAAGCATSAQPQPMASAKEPAKGPVAAAVADKSQFIARLVAGSPWKGEWQIYATKGTFELLFRMEDGKLKASLRNSTGCNPCRDGEVEIKAVSDGHIRLVSPSGTTYDYKLNQDGNLFGEGSTLGGYFIFASASPKK